MKNEKLKIEWRFVSGFHLLLAFCLFATAGEGVSTRKQGGNIYYCFMYDFSYKIFLQNVYLFFYASFHWNNSIPGNVGV